MHELGITRNIVAIVGEAAKGRRVTPRDARSREALGRDGDAIAFCFEVVAQGTALEGARLEIHEIDGPRPLRGLRPRIRSRDAVHALPVRIAPF